MTTMNGMRTAPLKSIRLQQCTGAPAWSTSISARSLNELAAPYRRRHLDRAANAIERGILLPAGTLPESVAPAIDGSATSLWPQDFRDYQLNPARTMH